MISSKETIWTELESDDCQIVDSYIPEGGTIEGGNIVIRHPKLKRPRSFILSRKGNWYSRYSGGPKCVYAEGFIIKGKEKIIMMRNMFIKKGGKEVN